MAAAGRDAGVRDPAARPRPRLVLVVPLGQVETQLVDAHPVADVSDHRHAARAAEAPVPPVIATLNGPGSSGPWTSMSPCSVICPRCRLRVATQWNVTTSYGGVVWVTVQTTPLMPTSLPFLASDSEITSWSPSEGPGAPTSMNSDWSSVATSLRVFLPLPPCASATPAPETSTPSATMASTAEYSLSLIRTLASFRPRVE